MIQKNEINLKLLQTIQSNSVLKTSCEKKYTAFIFRVSNMSSTSFLDITPERERMGQKKKVALSQNSLLRETIQLKTGTDSRTSVQCAHSGGLSHYCMVLRFFPVVNNLAIKPFLGYQVLTSTPYSPTLSFVRSHTPIPYLAQAHYPWSPSWSPSPVREKKNRIQRVDDTETNRADVK